MPVAAVAGYAVRGGMADASAVAGASASAPAPSAAAAAAAAVAAAAFEDSLGFQQLETLSQNQRKLGQLTARMTSILSNFDRRLARLERDIRPVHEDLHRLGRVQRNIQSVQGSLGKTLSTFDVIVDEESAVRAGPNPLDLDPYFQTLTRIADSLAYLRSTNGAKNGAGASNSGGNDAAGAGGSEQQEDRVTAKMHDLLDLGARSLIDDVLLPLLRNQSHRIDPADFIPLGIPLPVPDHYTAAQCQRLLIFLASLPAHPASPNTSPLANAIAQCAEVRAEYLLGSTRFLGASVREYAVEKIGAASTMRSAAGGAGTEPLSSGVGMGASVVSGSAMFGGMANRTEEVVYTRGSAGVREWLGAWLDMAETEYNFVVFLLDLSSTHSYNHGVHHDMSATLSAYVRNTFARVLAPSLAFLNQTLSTLHSHIRKNLASHMLFLLDLLSVISSDANANDGAGGAEDGLDSVGLDGMMQGIMGGLSSNSRGGGAGRRAASIPTRWETVLSPARLDTEWLHHVAQHASATAASGGGGGGSGAQGGKSNVQGGAAASSQSLADVSADVLARQASSMKATATAVLTKFLDDIRQLPLGRESDVPSTGINEIAYTGVAYIRSVCEYSDTITPLLYSLGSGNWLMGSSAAPVLTLSGVTGAGGAGAAHGSSSQYAQFGVQSGAGGQSSAQDEADEREKGKKGDAVLRRYIVDVIACILEALSVRAKAIRQTSTSSIFVLNNASFVRNVLLERDRDSLSPASPMSPTHHLHALHNPTDSDLVVADYLSTAAEELLAQTVRGANARYLDAWAPLVNLLLEDASSHHGGGGWMRGYDSDKMPVKERFAKFYEGLDDLERLHRAYPVGRDDRELKERLKKEVGRMILPMYTRFVTKHKTSGFSKDPSKHIRMTPSELEERINVMFR